ncbi:RidA family protein [Microbacterium sp. NPDC087592]|uniref:RidA family protein n=1 Tax=Microbacterium sp. NPDC087592 TaxID=3364193 RepID=UPI0037FD09C2
MISPRHAMIIERLRNGGYDLPEAPPAPIGAYTGALTAGHLIFTSGQLPLRDGVISLTGKVGEGSGLVSLDAAAGLAAQCAVNAIAALRGEIGDLGRIARIVKVTGFVASDPDFSDHSRVVDGASSLLKAVFGDAGAHTRSAVGVASLPRDSPVEVEVIALLRADPA